MPAADPTGPTTDPRAVSVEPPEASTDPLRDRRVGNDLAANPAAKPEDRISLMRTGRRLRPHSLKWRRRKAADLEVIEARRVSRPRRKTRRPKIGSRFRAPGQQRVGDSDPAPGRLLRRPSRHQRKARLGRASRLNRSMAAEESSAPVPGRLLLRPSRHRRKADHRNRSTVAAEADSVRISGPPLRRASRPLPNEPRRKPARHLQAEASAVTAGAANAVTEVAASAAAVNGLRVAGDRGSRR